MDSKNDENPPTTLSDETSVSTTRMVNDLTSANNLRTIRQHEAEVQELKRENFDLKLRIFFLEGKDPLNAEDSSLEQTNQRQTYSVLYEPTDSTNQASNQSTKFQVFTKNQSSSTSRNPATSPSSIGHGEDSEEIRNLKSDLQRCREENRDLRQRLDLSSLPTAELDKQTTDTGNMPTVISTSSWSPDHERQLRAENAALKQKIEAYELELEKTKRDLRFLPDQYQNEFRRLKEEFNQKLLDMRRGYETRINNMETQYSQQISVYESYRHEQDQATPANGNNEALLQKIDELQKEIDALNLQLEKASFNNQRSSAQIEAYEKMIRTITDECDELQRSEVYLANCIHRLVCSLNPNYQPPSTSNGRDEQISKAPSSTIARVALQLKNDADLISAQTHDVSEIQRLLVARDCEISGLMTDIRRFEARDVEVGQALKEEITKLQREKAGFETTIAALKTDKLQLQEQHNVFHERIQHLEEDIVRQKHQGEELSRERNTLEEQLKSATAQMQSFSKKYEKELEVLNENHRLQIERITGEFESERGQLNQQITKTKQDLATAQVETNDVQQRFINIQRDFERAQSVNQQQTTEIIKHKETLDRLTTKSETQEQEKQVLTQRIHAAEVELQKVKQLNGDFTESIRALESSVRDANNRILQSRNELEAVIIESKRKDSMIESLTAENDALRREIEQYQVEKRKSIHDIQILIEENTELKYELERLDLKIRLELKDEFESDLNKRLSQISETTDDRLRICTSDKEKLEFNLQQKNNEINELQHQLQNTKEELQKANILVKTQERQLAQCAEDLRKCKDYNKNSEVNISATYESRIGFIQNQNQVLTVQNQSLEKEVLQLQQQRSAHSDRICQLETEIREKEALIQKLRTDLVVAERGQNDIQATLESRIQQLDREIESRDSFIQEYRESIKKRDQRIAEIVAADANAESKAIQTLRVSLDSCEQKYQKLLNDTSLTIDELTRRINLLQSDKQSLEHRLHELTDKLQETVQLNERLQFETDAYVRKSDSLTINLNFEIENNKNLQENIQSLQAELNMEKKANAANANEQRQNYQKIIDDLKLKFDEREKSAKEMQNSLSKCDEKLNSTIQERHQVQTDLTRAQQRIDFLEKQHQSDTESRIQMEATLGQQLSAKEQEIKSLQTSHIETIQTMDKLHTRIAEIERENEALQNLIKQRDDEISRFKKDLYEQRSPKPLPSLSVTTRVATVLNNRGRLHIDHLTREELLYELDMTIQQCEELNKQLQNKLPSSTELHKQLGEVRDELTRQKYVNQVLWRKLDALIDIHGSNTRAELALELANYKDELAKLEIRTNDARANKLSSSSRSSSEQYLCSLNYGQSSLGTDWPTKNIKSTISLLERSNIEWQAKLARLTEQLGKSENQSRNYLRELAKYQRLLYEAGLIESSTRQRRRSADDSAIIGPVVENKINDDLTKIENIDELKQTIRNLRKYVQQLQMRVRIDAPDIIQVETTDKLNLQIQNLNSVIDTYKTESNVLKNELKKLFKTNEHNRKKQQQYEDLFQEQHSSIEQYKQKLNRYEQFFKKHNNLLTIFDEKSEHFIDPFDGYVIDFDLDVLQENDLKNKTSVAPKDSGISTATDASDLKRQVTEKDEQIDKLKADIEKRNVQIQEYAAKINKWEEDLRHAERALQLEKERYHQQTTDITIVRNDLEQALQREKSLTFELQRLTSARGDNQLTITLSHQMKSLEETIRALNTHGIAVPKADLLALLDEIRLLRQELEHSTEKQKELQTKLDESIRQSQTPREFTFSGRGVSYADLRPINLSGIVGGSSTIELDTTDGSQQFAVETEPRLRIRTYVVGEVNVHEELRKLIEDIKFHLKAIKPDITGRYRSRPNSPSNQTTIQALEDRLNELDQFTMRAVALSESYWKADLPEKNKYDEHKFIDQRLIEENQNLLLNQRKLIQQNQTLKRKCQEQAAHLEQVLNQLTKSNRKKADTGEYLALLLRPTLGVLQEARSNIEQHLKESYPNNIPPGSAQSSHRHRTNRKE